MDSFVSKRYQIYIVLNTYDIFEHNEGIQDLLARTWAMRLRGYKKYFPYGVLPIDSYDFLCHHIIIMCKRRQRPVAAIKSLTYENCKRCHTNFPIKEHLLESNSSYTEHSLAIDAWIETTLPGEIAYSTGFTIDPLLEKSEKSILNQLNHSLFYYFYSTYGIKNIIHGVSKRFGLVEEQKLMGFSELQLGEKVLSHIETKKYDNVESSIMVLNNLEFHKEYIEKIKFVKKLWDSRREFIGEVEHFSGKKSS